MSKPVVAVVGRPNACGRADFHCKGHAGRDQGQDLCGRFVAGQGIYID